MSIGFDDTDSPKGMCTTYLGFRLVDVLQKDVEFTDYPRLVRFNPNIPWKTRGNGAVGLKIKTSNPKKVRDKVISLIKKYSDIGNGANPAAVFYESDKIPEIIREFSRSALWRLIGRDYAKKFVQKNGIDSFHVGNGQGLVGAIGVIGYDFHDSTLELLSYRRQSKFGTPRCISVQSIKHMQEETFPRTFNSYDERNNRPMISPRGPDPVFYGIRGDDPRTLLRASKMVKTSEQLDGYMLFRSNQGTSDHLLNRLDARDLRPYMSGVLTGTISKDPVVRLGGHVFFAISAHGIEIPCALYKESGLSNSMTDLCIGDVVTVGGGVRRATKNYPRVINIEFVRVLELTEKIQWENPPCSTCNKRMKSQGSNQGYECIRCKSKASSKLARIVPRSIQPGLYLPTVSSQRHLTRPYQRQGVLKNAKFDGSLPWFCVFKKSSGE